MSETNISTKQPQKSQAPRISAQDGNPSRTCHPQGETPKGSRSPIGLIWRVDRRSTFGELRGARRYRSGSMSISWQPGPPADPPRVAYSISRKVGPAVTRNLIKRRLRMLARQVSTDLRPGAYLVTATPATANLSYADLESQWLKLTNPFREP